MSFKLSKTLLVAALSAAAMSSAMANLVNNGGFEAGAAGWTTAGFGIEPAPQYAHSGNNSMATGCVGPGCVSTLGSGAYFGQTITTTAGGLYDLSFWVGENDGPTSEFSVFWHGLMIADVLNPANNTLPTPSGPGMVQYTYTGLLASGSSTSFEIHGRQDPNVMFFDDVAIEQSGSVVPEPASLALAGLALAGLAATRRRA